MNIEHADYRALSVQCPIICPGTEGEIPVTERVNYYCHNAKIVVWMYHFQQQVVPLVDKGLSLIRPFAELT